MTTRAVNGEVSFPGLGLKIRGVLKSVNPGGLKRDPQTNGDGSVDHTEVYVPSMIKVDASMIAGVEIDVIRSIKNQKCLVEYKDDSRRKIAFEQMTYSEPSDIDENGVWPLTFTGTIAPR